MDRTVAKRVQAYEERNRRKGLKRVIVWVPADQIEELHRLAARLRQAKIMFEEKKDD